MKRPVEVHYREVAPGGEVICTMEGDMKADPEFDYIIRGVGGER